MEIVEGAAVVGRVPQEEFPLASPAPQPPAPEPPGKPAPPPADRPPPDPVAANPKPAEEGALCRALVDAGVEATLAYTVEKRMHAMTSETAAAQIQPVLAELREMRESTVTKADLAEFATKADLAEFVTKADLAEFGTQFATKADLSNLETRMIRWMFGALMAHAALTVTLVVGFVSLLR